MRVLLDTNNLMIWSNFILHPFLAKMKLEAFCNGDASMGLVRLDQTV
jgi:hypothetical protein